MKKKNIVMIMTDQMHKNALGKLNNEIITPNLDRLAEEGTIFKNAYSNNPVCGPFRGCLFTGKYTKDNRVYKNNDPLPMGVETMADIFNKNGYETSFVGKWHLGGHGNEPIPEALRGGFTHFIGYQCYNGFWVENKFYDEMNEVYRYGGHRTDVTTDLGIERMKMLAEKDHPFLHVIFYQSPHYPEQPRDMYSEMYEGTTLTVPPNYIDVDPFTPTYDPYSARPLKYCPDYQRYGKDMQEYKRLYNAMVTQVDHGVGRIMDELRSLGIYDDTMIIFSSDHGDMQGSHGLLNKCLPYEESCGIPLIIKGNKENRFGEVDIPVSAIDYMTTAMTFVGMSKNKKLQGRCLLDVAKNPTTYENHCVYAENYQTSDRWIMVRSSQYKLVVHMDNLEPSMLFNMEEDPYEMKNLVGDERYIEIVTVLLQKLKKDFTQNTY